MEVSCSFEVWLVGLEVWAYKKLFWICVPYSLVGCSLVFLVLLLLFYLVVVFGFSSVVCWSLASYFVLWSSPKRGIPPLVLVFVVSFCCFVVVVLLFGFINLFLIKLKFIPPSNFYKFHHRTFYLWWVGKKKQF